VRERSQKSEVRSQNGNRKTVNPGVRIGDINQNVKMEEHESGMQNKIWNFKSVFPYVFCSMYSF
jgi:hypothetical protein